MGTKKKNIKSRIAPNFNGMKGAEGQPQGLKCKVGWKTVTICEGLSEDETTAILVALQKYLTGRSSKNLFSTKR